MKGTIRTKEEIEKIYSTYGDMIYRICFSYMKNDADTEDIVSETFIQLIHKSPSFVNDEHEKAWLIRVATNLCKNSLKHWRRRCIDIDSANVISDSCNMIDETMELVLTLSDKYKTVVYLYYYEGYNTEEIARILKKPSSTVRNHLIEARQLLKERLGEIG